MKNLVRDLSALLVAAGLATTIAYAQAPVALSGYPAKPVKMIVPLAAGGGTDYMARLVAQKLSDRVGQQFVVDNRPGAAGAIGTSAAAKSANDGHTLLMTSIGTAASAMSYYAKTGYDIRTDFAPISMLGMVTLVLVIHPALPVKNVKELIALTKARPGELNFASSGTGGLSHLTSEMFKQMAKIEIVHVPYKGTSLFLPDLLSGQVVITMDTPPAYLQFIKTGRLRALAVTSERRSLILPEVPTIGESGIPGFESIGSYALLAPAGTAKDVIAYLNRETHAVLQLTDLKEKAFVVGIEPVGSTPEALDTFTGAEIVKWARVIKAAGIRVE